jgi:hypothetical protein
MAHPGRRLDGRTTTRCTERTSMIPGLGSPTPSSDEATSRLRPRRTCEAPTAFTFDRVEPSLGLMTLAVNIHGSSIDEREFYAFW